MDQGNLAAVRAENPDKTGTNFMIDKRSSGWRRRHGQLLRLCQESLWRSTQDRRCG